MDNLPQRIRDYRAAHQLTAQQFMQQIDPSMEYLRVYAWEREDKRTIPSPPILARLAELDIITIAERDALTFGKDAA